MLYILEKIKKLHKVVYLTHCNTTQYAKKICNCNFYSIKNFKDLNFIKNIGFSGKSELHSCIGITICKTAKYAKKICNFCFFGVLHTGVFGSYFANCQLFINSCIYGRLWIY